MSKVIHAVFDSPEVADRAVEELGLPTDNFSAVVHADHVREEDVQLAGTQALRGAVLGGLFVGVFGMLAAVLLIWPAHGWHGAWGAGLLMGFAGSLFGVVAGGVAGASDCKSTIRDEAEYAAKRRKVMVTCEVDRGRDAARVIEAFEDHGATHVDAA